MPLRSTSISGTKHSWSVAADTLQSDAARAPEDLRLLLNEGSPLGGTRPKSAVVDNDGSLAIAKFPKADDDRSIPHREVLAFRRKALRRIWIWPRQAAASFALKPNEAEDIIEDVSARLNGWQDIARQLGMGVTDVKIYETAFEIN